MKLLLLDAAFQNLFLIFEQVSSSSVVLDEILDYFCFLAASKGWAEINQIFNTLRANFVI
jgi:hypothetical protein